MKETPKSLRLQIGIFGRTNVGKSSFLNLLAGQEVAITSPVPGTTTDVVEKSLELLPLGPVVFLDTAGMDDQTSLAEPRREKSGRIFSRADAILLLTESEIWTDYEEEVLARAREGKVPVLAVINKIDLRTPSADFIRQVEEKTAGVLPAVSTDKQNRDRYLTWLTEKLLVLCPDSLLDVSLVGDLLSPESCCVLVVPIDLEAPKGRLILPQVQTIRDALDHGAAALVVRDREYPRLLAKLTPPPELVVCDSQVVLRMVADTPEPIRCTTFSILFSRFKGDLVAAARGVTRIRRLRDGDRVLIAEACTHHPLEDDIGRVKIPAWLRRYVGSEIDIEVCSGRDYPDNLKDYQLIIHCGACMLTRREMLFRVDQARRARVPLTNYGVCISFLQGVLERVLTPFPEALAAYLREDQK